MKLLQSQSRLSLWPPGLIALQRRWLPALLLSLAGLALTDAGAQQLRFDTARQWGEWNLPLGAVTLTPQGVIEPIRIEKNIDPVKNVAAFAGGIRNAGSNLADAPLIIDGDLTTGWSPDPDDRPRDWFIEVNLGRGVSAYSVTLVFDEAAPPFELFDLFLSTGEPETDNIAAPIEGSLVYRLKERFKENRRHRVTYEIEQIDFMPIQFIRFEPLLHVPGAKLVEVEVEAIGDNLSLGLLDRGGIVDVNINLDSNAPQPLGKARALVDGDLYERWNAGTASRAPNDINAHIVLDLGAVYWTDLTRIIGGVVVRSGFGGGITTRHYVQRRRWGFRVYEFMTSDGSLSPDGTRIWTKHFSGISPGSETSKGLVDHHYDLVPTRYVRVLWKFWDTACSSSFTLGEVGGRAQAAGCAAGGATDEIQVFGEGFPREVSFSSPLIDLDNSKNINSIEWVGDTPPGTRIEIRSRTGNEVVESYTFRDKNGKEVTETRYNKLIKSFRGPIDTSLVAGGDWSPWSNIYGSSGEAFQSPSPRRFMEIDVQLVTESREAAASLDQLTVNFTPPLAQQVIGEVYPLEVNPGDEIEFSYFLRPSQTQRGGFDSISMEASAPLQFMAAYVEGEAIEAEETSIERGFQVTFPQSISSDQLVEMRFESAVFLQSTRFDVFLQDSEDLGVRQRVDPGDAAPQVESSTNIVSLPVTRDLLANLELSAPIITPNGDGRNDALQVELDLVNVIEPRSLQLRLYDLSGRLVQVVDQESTAGQQVFTWNGRDPGGELVPPGIYIVELNVDGDSQERGSRRVISVVY
ncbi:MAG: T9SS type A sorting domain-containing protein [Candidatus Latescibacteria bacterium]|nr:T9SS type A sorting domain-containing protein [Candidatus Latescibacterota bacterium]